MSQVSISETMLPAVAVRLARIYSNVISPPIVTAVLGFVIALADTASLWPGLAWGAVYGILLCGIPMIFVAYLLKTGRVSDLHLRNKGERHIPYLLTLVGALVGLFLVVLFDGPPLLFSLLICNMIGLAALGSINVYWLISNHAASVILFVTFAGFVFGPSVTLALLPLVILTLAARLILKRHTIAQLLAGLIVGAAPVLVLAGMGLI